MDAGLKDRRGRHCPRQIPEDIPDLPEVTVKLPPGLLAWIDSVYNPQLAKWGKLQGDALLLLADVIRQINERGESGFWCAQAEAAFGGRTRQVVSHFLRVCPYFILKHRHCNVGWFKRARVWTYAPNLQGVVRRVIKDCTSYNTNARVPGDLSFLPSAGDGVLLDAGTRRLLLAAHYTCCRRLGFEPRYLPGVGLAGGPLLLFVAGLRLREAGGAGSPEIERWVGRLRRAGRRVVAWFRRGRVFHNLSNMPRSVRGWLTLETPRGKEEVVTVDLSGTWFHCAGKLAGSACPDLLDLEGVYEAADAAAEVHEETRQGKKAKVMSHAFMWPSARHWDPVKRSHWTGLCRARPRLAEMIKEARGTMRASEFAIRLMRIEAMFFLDICWPRLRDERILTAPLHDAFMVAKSQAPRVKQILEEEALKFFGYVPAFKIS